MNKNKVIQFLEYFSVFLWLSLLIKTDSYYSVYLVIGILATILISKSKKTKKKNTWLEYIFASLLSLAVALANYSIFAENTQSTIPSSLISIFLVIILFVCGLIIFLNILSFIRTFYLNPSKKHKVNPKKIFFISFLIFSLIDLFILFTCCYPGSLSPDSINEIEQILTGQYSNHHPFYFTILIYPFIQIGINVFNDINIGIAFYNIFQIFILSSAFSYSISTLSHLGFSKKILIATIIILALMPYNIVYSFTIWKDVLFGAAFLFFIVALYRYFTKLQPYKQSRLLQIILIFISGLTICLFRSNALIAIFVSTIIFFIIFKKKYIKLGIVLTLIVISAFILKRPVLKSLDVKQPDIIESLSLPSQQIAKTLKTNMDNIGEEDISLINNIANAEEIANAYNPTLHDSIKDVVRINGNQNYIKEHALDFISLYIKLGLKYPAQYLTAWIDITKGYWNSGYGKGGVLIWANEIVSNNFGLQRNTDTFVSKSFDSAIELFRRIPFFQLFMSIGLTVWILFLLLYRALLNKKHELIFLLILPISVWATLLIAAPVHAEFRYTYFLFTCLPFLTTVILTRKTSLNNKGESKNEK